VVIDGQKRVRALRRLKADVAKATVWQMPQDEALLRSYQMASGTRWNAIEEGWLVHELHRQEGWDLGRVAQGMNRTKSWVSRRLGLVESLPEGVLEKIHKGKIGAYVAMKYLLPLVRANDTQCESFAETIASSGMSTREIAVLYQHLTTGPRKVSQRILEDPWKFLKALDAAKKINPDPDLSDRENRCLKSLKLIGNVSLGLARYLPEVVTDKTNALVHHKFKETWLETHNGFKLLEKKIKALKLESVEG
jgi:ParB family transcriptional regulator, chromosome partitioning protein